MLPYTVTKAMITSGAMGKEPSAMTDAGSSASTGLPGGAGPGHWVLDPHKSSVKVSQKHMWGLITVRASFSELAGDGDVSADGSVTGTLRVGAASVDTKNSKRDKHLRSADFFHADAHPHITFTAKNAKLDDNGDLAVSGDLEAAGTSRPLSLTANVSEASQDSATLTTTVNVDRLNYGMTWNSMGMMVKAPATVSVTAHFTRQPA
jgi:polyisoprenoid-binding protein YceI